MTEDKTKLSWLMATISRITKRNETKMRTHRYVFENTKEAAKKNIRLLKSNRYDFERAMKKEQGTMLEARSEFRPAHILETLFGKHET